MLEHVIWLLGSQGHLNGFTTELLGNLGHAGNAAPFYHRTPSGDLEARPAVARWLSHFIDQEPECSADTALGVLLRLIRDNMLVSNGRVDWGATDKERGGANALKMGERATATEVWFCVDKIITDTTKGRLFLFQGHRMGPGEKRIPVGPPPPVATTGGLPIRVPTPRSAGQGYLKPAAALRGSPRLAAAQGNTPAPPTMRQVRI